MIKVRIKQGITICLVILLLALVTPGEAPVTASPITVTPQVAAGDFHTVGLRSDGTVVAVGAYSGACEVSEWTDIKQIAAGRIHTLGLKTDGTVVAAPDSGTGTSNVSGWEDITYIAASWVASGGVKEDGTVILTRYYFDYAGGFVFDVEEVKDWIDIKQIAIGWFHVVGLKKDGTVVVAGNNYYGECDVTDWTNIKQIGLGYFHTVGLKTGGTVVATGDNTYGQCDVDDWDQVYYIAVGPGHTVGLGGPLYPKEGLLLATGDNTYGQCDVVLWDWISNTADKTKYRWHCIAGVAAGEDHTVALKDDGVTVITTGHDRFREEDYLKTMTSNPWLEISDYDEGYQDGVAACAETIAELNGQITELEETIDTMQTETDNLNYSLDQCLLGLEEIADLLATPPGQRSSTSSYEGDLGNELNGIIEMLLIPPGDNISDATPHGKKK